jgi:hypothetical protein
MVDFQEVLLYFRNMNIGEEAIEVCRTAERALRSLMQKAIEAREYRYLPTLARMAEQLSALGTRINPPPTDFQSTDVNAVRKRVIGKSAKYSLVATGKVRYAKQGHHDKPVLPIRGSGYPRFEREDEILIKIGWSKTSRIEYEHRAPRRIVDALLKAIQTAGNGGAVFTVESILPLRDPTDETEVSGYQVYLALAWFRIEGLLQQHGREGYSLLLTSNLEQTVEERWKALFDRRSNKEVKK